MQYQTHTHIQTVFRKALFVFATIFVFGVATPLYASGLTVQTLPGDSTQTTVTFKGYFSTTGTPTSVRFEYGPTTLLDSFTPYQSFSATSGEFEATVTGLTPGSTIYYRAEGINSTGTGFGSILNETLGTYQAPRVQTLPIANTNDITGTGAILQGRYESPDATVNVSFEYANNSQMIGAYTSTPLSKPASTGAEFSQTITGLTPNTTYWYRAKAQNSAGTVLGTTILSFRTTTGGNPPSTCSITSFGNATTISQGGSATLSWNTTNCTSVTLSTIGTVGLNGSTTVSPQYTTTYTLTAIGSNGSDTETVTITVGSVSSSQCIIESFELDDYSVDEGDRVTVSWETENCTSVFVSGGGIGENSLSGSERSSRLYGDTTFTLMVYHTNQATQIRYLTVSVDDDNTSSGNSCSISDFYALPSQVTRGQTTVLHWDTSNCDEVDIAGSNLNLQNYSRDGSYTVSPTASGTYYLTATGSRGSSQSQVYVTVSDTPIYSGNMYACSDGIDNDGDEYVDLGDTGCTSGTDTSEYNDIYTGGGNTDPIIIYTGGGTRIIREVGNTLSTLGNVVLGVQTNSGSYRDYYRDSRTFGNTLGAFSLGSGVLFPNNVLGWLIAILLIMIIIVATNRMYRGNRHHDNQSYH